MMTPRNLVLLGSAALGLLGCGRDVEPSDVKLVGVGNNPDEIGPAPTPYGGLVEFNHVEFAGGALPLGAMGLSSYTEAGPAILNMAPPYGAVFGLSYIFDTKLRGTTSLALVQPNPPPAAGSCYTQLYPAGPFDGGFNTVDVGDYVKFTHAETGDDVVVFDRIPRDYPPEASRLSVVYQVIQGYSPTDRTRLIPDPDGSNALGDMVEVPYRTANFPHGEGVSLQWPGGFTTFDKPVGSVPVPYRPDNATITLPQEWSGVHMTWNGPRYYYSFADQDYITNEPADYSTCFEFTSPLEFGSDGAPTSAADCADLTSPPREPGLYNAFRGQMYTGPWETQDGVTFAWNPDESDDTVSVAVKFLAPIDTSSSSFTSRQVALNPDDPEDERIYRDAQVCEDGTVDGAEFRFDEEQWAPDGNLEAVLQGNPNEVVAQVVCNVPKESGEFTLTQDMVADAFEYARSRGAAGSIFMVGKQQTSEVAIPAVKDPYDQRHDVNPVFVTAKTIRIGRFYWNFATEGQEEAGGEQ